jgi:L-ascorbate metabolism protein UlaG (beta-lactamase superfamily)
MRSDVYRGYNGYTVETDGFRIIFGGDTAYTDAFRRLKSSRPFDLAIMPIGAYDPWIRVHCNPEQAWSMANDAGANVILPVHHQTFRLSHEPKHEPIERVMRAAGSEAERIGVRELGGEFHF